jgi:IclR family KDG regulon transcriptional repressor
MSFYWRASRKNVLRIAIAPILHSMTSRNFIALRSDAGLYGIGIGSYMVDNSYMVSIMLCGLSNLKRYTQSITYEICQFAIRSKDSVLHIAKVDSKETAIGKMDFLI